MNTEKQRVVIDISSYVKLRHGPWALIVDRKYDDAGARYLAVWWDGNTRLESWVYDAEIEAEEPPKKAT
jgi:hypothetical protein